MFLTNVTFYGGRERLSCNIKWYVLLQFGNLFIFYQHSCNSILVMVADVTVTCRWLIIDIKAYITSAPLLVNSVSVNIPLIRRYEACYISGNDFYRTGSILNVCDSAVFLRAIQATIYPNMLTGIWCVLDRASLW